MSTGSISTIRATSGSQSTPTAGPAARVGSSSTHTISTFWLLARRSSYRPIPRPQRCPATPMSANSARVNGRYDDRLARSQNVEIVWVEDDPTRAAGPAVGVDWLPEVARIVLIDPVDIDQIGVAARLVADDAAPGVAGDIDGEGEAIADCLAR